MKPIEAYKCEFCGKVYELKSSCSSHQNRCYFNPKTRSCASCEFNVEDREEYKPHHFRVFRSCTMKHPIAQGLKTKCEDYQCKMEVLDEDEIPSLLLNEECKF